MSDFCDMPEFYTEKLVKARKPFKCCETREVIAKGEMYWRITGKWDGVINTHTQSVTGYNLCRKINLDYIEDCDICFGGLKEWLSDYAAQADDAEFSAMVAACDWAGISAWFDAQIEKQRQRRKGDRAMLAGRTVIND